MLAQKWTGQPVSGWWLSEKFDGCRAFWDGTCLRTRTWRAIDAPAWFVASLPARVAVDGELWLGRGSFQISSELARFARSADPVWRQARFMAFDVPSCDAIPFEQRIAALAAFANQIVQVVPVRRCLGADDVRAELAAVVAGGGEGCVVKCPGHCYEFGRSSQWLKVKPVGVE
jgi:DNA ligase-1